MNKYTERLINEWKQHSKIVIAVDYDSTIFPWHTISNDEDMSKVVKVLKDCQNVGAYIVINTCSAPDRHKDIEAHCYSIGLKISGINSNPIDLPYGRHGKVYANIYLDDRAGLLQALEILEEAMYMQRAHKNTLIHLDEIG
jgi:hypothetical protein